MCQHCSKNLSYDNYVKICPERGSIQFFFKTLKFYDLLPVQTQPMLI